MTPFHQIATAGFAATAISYGPARIGFSLFVPQFSADFDLSDTAVGLISSLGLSGFFISLLIAQFLLSRRGPGVPVLAGLLAGTVGMGLRALATNTAMLSFGVFLAASSAGFAWTPFNDAVHRKLNMSERSRALSEISTGTSIGIVAAGLAALPTVFARLSWRVCWGIFAAASGVACIINWTTLPRMNRTTQETPGKGKHYLRHAAMLPLLMIGFVFGITSSVYISFAADHMMRSGGVPGLPAEATPAMVFILLGLVGLIGLATGSLRNKLGLTTLLRALMIIGTVSVVLAAVWPNRWFGLVPSASLQGVYIMMTNAVLALWSEPLFPSTPSLCFAASLIATALGSVAGPSIAGVVYDVEGYQKMFLGTAALPLAAALFLRRKHVWENPVDAAWSGLEAAPGESDLQSKKSVRAG